MFRSDNKLDEKTKSKFFNIIRRKINTEQGVVNNGVDLQFHPESNLINYLRIQTERDEFYAEEPVVSASSLVQNLSMFRDSESDNGPSIIGLSDLVNFLEKEYAHEVTKIDNMIKEGVISFDGLSFLFKKGDKVYTWINDEKVGGEVINFKYHQSFFESSFRVTIKYIKSDGATFKVDTEDFPIRAFSKTQNINELPVSPLTTEVEEELVKRGRLYQKIALGAAYCYNEGNLFWKEYWKTTVIKGIGRVMIDNFNFARVNPDYDRNYGEIECCGSRTQFTELSGDQLYCTDPWVRGFSFTAKKWGEIAVSKLKDVEFDEKAYDQLVLNGDRKALVKSLVEHSSESFNDIITGKGGGCIFLLHGPPGCGKTLTAESIAELLKRPLYSVSVGELGVDPDDLEERLRQILDMASAWDAVVLIDEADIFLEARDEHDIERNAMVGIFLRLLEYHQGVLFLTTNRVKCFDEAFFSRISVSLEYAPLDVHDRTQIWFTLLEAANIKLSQADHKSLASHELNGRQIKNVIRLSQSLAKSENIAVTLQHFEKTISITGQFQANRLDK